MENRALCRRAGPGLDFIDLTGSACRERFFWPPAAAPEISKRQTTILNEILSDFMVLPPVSTGTASFKRGFNEVSTLGER